MDIVRFFESTFQSMPFAVIVCRNEPDYPLVYVNTSAKILINPLLDIEGLRGRLEITKTLDMLHFENSETFKLIREGLLTSGGIKGFKTGLLMDDGRNVQVEITANLVTLSADEYFTLYIKEALLENPSGESDDIMPLIFHTAYHTADINESINKVLSLAGSYVNVSRVYIFEEIDDEHIRNSYEWCADGIDPAIDDLQSLSADEYDSETLLRSGMYITNDVRELPESDRGVLEPQGIKALAVLPIVQGNRSTGYMGFDDCEHYRSWSSREIDFLKNILNLVTALLARRDAEEQKLRTINILQTISDTIDHVIYVNIPNTYELLFANQKLADRLNVTIDELIGKPCWKVLQKGKNGPCDYCPMPRLFDEKGVPNGESYRWEFQNTHDQRWYQIKDAIIPWIDGREVHIETAIDITDQKDHEEELRYIASIDTMTGVFNREWGYKVMQDLMAEATVLPQAVSLVFVDLDGLKITNDTYGHDAGDDMINTIVETIRSTIRKSDTICRWGGDEFILLLRCEPKIAEKLMVRVTGQLDIINESGEKPYKLGFSYGIKNLTSDTSLSIDVVISEADREMYEQKMAKRMKRS